MDSTTESNPTTSETSEPTDQKAKIQLVVKSLRALLEGDQREQRETFEYLKKALDEDRPSNRRLFQ
jgi:hypothetical protein